MLIPHPGFRPIVFVPAREEADIRGMPVQHISAIAHHLIDDGQGGNHYCFYLSTKPGHSVRIDPAHSGIQGPSIPRGSKANFVVSALPCDTPPEAQYVDALSAAPGLTVGRFLDAITDAGRDKFESETSGRGCRSWATDQIGLFLSLGLIINAKEAEETKKHLVTEFVDGRRTGREVPLNKGAYYA